ncbi:MAG: PAS domain S-box protein [bacterium]|nr:PAS domain S-box protein [bacterium]
MTRKSYNDEDVKIKELKTELEQSKNSYNLLLNAITSYVFTVIIKNNKPDSTIHSHGCVGITGYSGEELNHDPHLWYNMVHEDDKERVLDHVESILSCKTPKSIEHRITHKNGNIIWIKKVIVPSYNDKGKLISYDGVIEDITERKRFEISLKESADQNKILKDLLIKLNKCRNLNEMLSPLLDSAMDICHMSSGMVYTTENDIAVCRLHTGLPEVLVEKVKELSMDLPVIKKIIKSKIPVILESITKEVSGPDRPFGIRHAFSTPLRAGKEVFGFLNIATDREITDKENILHKLGVLALEAESFFKKIKTEEALRESEERFRTIFKTSPDSITINRVDDGTYLDVNDGFTAMTGYKKKEVVGKSSLGIKIWQDPKDRDRLVEALGKSDTVRNLEIGFTTKKGDNKATLVSSKIINLNNEPHILSITREITERLSAEQERKVLQDQLFQAQKLESIGRLAGGIAHDFNNILAGIMGYAELLKIQFPDPGSVGGQAADVIISGTERAADLTQQLLGFARGGKYNPVTLNINDIIEEAVRLSEKILETNTSVNFDLTEPVNNINADKQQISQILTNLIINSKDAMPTGGELSFKTENIIFDKDNIDKFPALLKGNYVKVTVADTGMGMPCDVVDNIFEPFFTTKGKGKGTGLGLATVYGIVKNHGGYIYCDSEPGKGAVFTLFFPSISQKNLKNVPVQKVIRGSTTVLAVDDEKHVRDLTKLQLEKLGYNVILAANGSKAVEIFRKDRNIDLVLLDMVMPGMPGKETFMALKEIKKDVKVILVSGYSQNGKAKEIIDKGTRAFLQKPFKLHEISKLISDVLKEK